MTGNFPNFWNMPVKANSHKISGNAGKPPAIPLIDVDSCRGVINAAVTQPGAYILTIYNSVGRRVTEPTFGRSEGAAIIPLKKNMQSGVYWISLHTASGSSTERMIITR